jgi:hypothetical protein
MTGGNTGLKDFCTILRDDDGRAAIEEKFC